MGKITGLHEDGKSVTEIADALGRSYNCIGNFLKQKRPYTTWFQNTSKNDAKHNQVFIQIGVTFGIITVELIGLF